MTAGPRILDANGAILFDQVTIPKHLITRAKGLIGRRELSDREAWWFDHCRAVHMVGMQFSIDVVFVDRRGYITKVVDSLHPFLAAISIAAEHAVEMGAGMARRHGLRVGDRITLER